jgi:[acyl-carrier-protein] S-malonyltransferase
MKYVLLTQGQGAQFTLMGKDFHDNFSCFRQTMEEAEDVTKLNIRQWIYEGTNEELSKTDKSQLAIYATTIAIYNVLKEVCPDVQFESGIGLSLGEYSVLSVAKALKFEDGLKVVKFRGELMQQASLQNPGKMAAVIGMEAEKIVPFLQGTAVLANLNTALQTVISGSHVDVDQTALLLKQNGARRVIDLDVSGAFHSSLMQNAFNAFSPFLESFSFQDPIFPIIMNATGEKERSALQIRHLLAKQLVSSVLLKKSIEIAGNSHKFLELGPGTVVKGLVQKNIDANVISINTVNDLKEFEVCVS